MTYVSVEQRRLGETGLVVSSLGLGAGGASRLGLARGRTTDEAAGVVRRAIDLGINYVDTAPAYGTEHVVGRVLREVGREELLVSTKVRHRTGDGTLFTPHQVRLSIEQSLRALHTDHIDVLFLHGVRIEEYEYCRDVLAPELIAMRDAGVVRAVGVSEPMALDPAHAMQHRALADGFCGALLTGINVLNPSAKQLVPAASADGVGIVAMHAIRWLLTSVDRLRAGLEDLVTRPDRVRDSSRLRSVLAMLDGRDFAGLLPAAAYRYVLDQPGFSSVLIGTGDQTHLEQNIAAIAAIGDDSRAAELLAILDGLLEGEPAGSGDDPG